MKRGSDHAHACASRNGTDARKKMAAQALVRRWREVAHYTASTIRIALTPKSSAFRARDACTRSRSKRPTSAMVAE